MPTFYEKQFCSRQGTVQNVSTSTSSAASSAFGAQTYQIMVVNTNDTAADLCYVLIGNSPTATATTGTVIPPLVPVYFQVTPGEAIAAILSSGTGTLNVTELC